uniref:Uncharacterized protein n=1 Tax=Arundo donax TaxID=35708 RepID=A0A0A9AS00_ARUDO
MVCSMGFAFHNCISCFSHIRRFKNRY